MDGADHRSRERELGQITVEHFGGTEKGQASVYDQMISVKEQSAFRSGMYLVCWADLDVIGRDG